MGSKGPMTLILGIRIAHYALGFTIRKFGVVVRCFWPLITANTVAEWAIVATANLGETLKVEVPPDQQLSTGFVRLGSGLGLILLPIYMAFMFCSGAVLWHRYIVLHERVTLAPLWPVSRSWKYAWYGLIYTLANIALLIPAVIFRYSYIKNWTKHYGSASISTVASSGPIYVPASFIFGGAAFSLAGSALMLVLARRWLLLFPYAAVAEGKVNIVEYRRSVSTPEGVVVALFMIYVVWNCANMVYQFLFPFRWEPDAWLAKVVIWGLYGTFLAFIGATPLVVLSEALRQAIATGKDTGIAP
jgi:hypothetical protein